MLCNQCSQLARYAYTDGNDTDQHSLHDYNLDYLERSSESCDLCHMIVSKALLYPDVRKEGIRLSVQAGEGLHLCKHATGIMIYSNSFPFCTLPYPIGDSEGKEPPCEGRLIHKDASSFACMELANRWLEVCLKSHDRCRSIKVTEYPTRLLDLSDPSTPGDVRLINADSIAANYIALSHTWGGSRPLTTTLATLDARMKKIPISELPATFRDAVIITRNFGCRYLWIDSLCIIQDSSEDWQRESTKMHQIYRGSLLTISSLHSDNSNAGIFSPRHPQSAIEIAPAKSILWGPIYVASQLEWWNNILGRSVLNTRGWTLQERLLSPRLLHFSDDELLWECLTCVKREGTRLEVNKYRGSNMEQNYNGPLMDLNMPPADMSKQPYLLASLNEWAAEDKDPFLVWHKAVSYFSGRSLTYGKDKLPALSGLAAEVHLQTGATYLAGLWKENLLNGLCWQLYPTFDATSVTRPSQYRAPSWSWASLDGKVEYFEPPIGIGESLMENVLSSLSGGMSYRSSTLTENMSPIILDSRVRKLGLDPMGEVTSGLIRLRCQSLPAFMIPDPQSRHFRKYHKVLLGVGRRIVPSGSWLFESEQIGFKGVIDSIDDLGVSQCVFIPLARRTANYIDHVICLLVVPVRPQTFRRIGISWMQEEVAVTLFQRVGKNEVILI